MENLDRGAYYIREILYSLTFPMREMHIDVPDTETWGIRIKLEPRCGILFPFQCYYHQNTAAGQPFIRFSLGLNIHAEPDFRTELLCYLIAVNLETDLDCCFVLDALDEVLLTGDIRTDDTSPSYSQFLFAIGNLFAVAAFFYDVIEAVAQGKEPEAKPGPALSLYRKIQLGVQPACYQTQKKHSLIEEEVLCDPDSPFRVLCDRIDSLRGDKIDARIEDEFKHYKRLRKMLETYAENTEDAPGNEPTE